jgi:hypothetical protein
MTSGLYFLDGLRHEDWVSRKKRKKMKRGLQIGFYETLHSKSEHWSVSANTADVCHESLTVHCDFFVLFRSFRQSSYDTGLVFP